MKAVLLKVGRASPAVVALAVSAGLAHFLSKFEPIFYSFFACPTAHLVGFFFGVDPRMNAENYYVLPLGAGLIQIVPACIGINFFALTVGVWLFYDYDRLSWFMPRRLLLGLGMGYLLTILANSLRIISLFYVESWLKPVLPSLYMGALHQGVGISVFLSLLIGYSIILERFRPHGTTIFFEKS